MPKSDWHMYVALGLGVVCWIVVGILAILSHKSPQKPKENE